MLYKYRTSFIVTKNSEILNWIKYINIINYFIYKLLKDKKLAIK